MASEIPSEFAFINDGVTGSTDTQELKLAKLDEVTPLIDGDAPDFKNGERFTVDSGPHQGKVGQVREVIGRSRINNLPDMLAATLIDDDGNAIIAHVPAAFCTKIES